MIWRQSLNIKLPAASRTLFNVVYSLVEAKTTKWWNKKEATVLVYDLT